MIVVRRLTDVEKEIDALIDKLGVDAVLDRTRERDREERALLACFNDQQEYERMGGER